MMGLDTLETYKLMKYTKNKLHIKSVFLYTIILETVDLYVLSGNLGDFVAC